MTPTSPTPSPPLPMFIWNSFASYTEVWGNQVYATRGGTSPGN